jgi:predicted RNA-binding protein associated with RNAse of E/G family
VKIRVDGRVERFRCELTAMDERGVIVAWRPGDAVTVGDWTMPAGGVSYGFFWHDRRHNLYRFTHPDGSVIWRRMDLTGLPRIGAREVTWHDLVVDVVVPATGEAFLEDQDELAEAVQKELIPEAEAEEILVYGRNLLASVDEVIAETERWLVEALTA